MGTLITGEATDDLRMGVKILSEAYLVYIFFIKAFPLLDVCTMFDVCISD